MVVRKIALGMSVLLLIGCELPVSPTQTDRAISKGALVSTNQQTLPFSGVVTGEASFDTNPRGCASGFTTITEAKGTASHLGLTVFRSDHCLALATGAIEGGRLVLIAADGDEIHATYEGVSAPLPPQIGDPIAVSATMTIVGGTGRFAQATGTAEIVGEVTFEGFSDPSWHGRWEWKGTLTY
jgi:hypothetical protein